MTNIIKFLLVVLILALAFSLMVAFFTSEGAMKDDLLTIIMLANQMV